MPPHALQVPAAQTVVAAVQAIPAQHGCVAAPQAAHVPFAHTDPLAQTFPQQGCVATPHAAHVPLVWQTAPVLQVVPQHCWLTPPQGEHLFAAHR